MKQILRSLCTLLMLVAWASGFAASGDNFTLVTAESELKAGDVIIIVNKDASKALSTNQKDYNRGASSVVISGNDVTSADDTQEITLEGQSGAWYFNVGNGYLYAASSSSNYLKTQTVKNDNSKASLSFNSSGTTIKFLGRNSRNVLRYNPNNGSPLFTCYKSASQKAVFIYKKASTKTATTLTFPEATINIEEGNEASFAAQTAILKAGETELDNAVTYTTNNDAMFEAYKANVGPKALKAGAYGTAVVTATFAGDATYAASTATYTVNYTEKAKPATTLDFGFATKTANINETFTATATLKAGETAISGAVTYKSSNTEVATVNETTGEVSALTAGITTITATFAGTSEYKSSTASYDLTVVDPNATEVTFDFSKPADYGYKAPGSGSATNLEEGEKIQSGVITITNIKSGKSGSNTNMARFHNKGGNITFRVYANGEITLSAQPGYTITKFVFASSQGGSLTVSPGTYDSKTKTWEGNAQTITLTIPNGEDATWFQTMTVTYSKVSANPTLTLDENAEDTKDVLLNTESSKVYDVTLTRTLTANVWNTICLPFDVTAEQIANVLKSKDNVKVFDREDASKQTIYFQNAATMTAGVPYLIKPTESATELVFKGVKITEHSAKSSLGNDYGVCGTFVPYKLSTDGTDLFLKTDGKFYVPAEGKETMRGFRAFFIVPKNTAGAALNLSFGEATGIDGVAVDAVKSVKIYNVNGQYVGTNLEALPKGLYVVGGKKVLK